MRHAFRAALTGFLLLASPSFAQRWDRNAPAEPIPGIAILGESLTPSRAPEQDRPSRFHGFGDVSGSTHVLGGSETYTFTDGTSTTRSRLGGTDFYSGTTPSLSGSTGTIGGTTFGSWMDGTISTHSRIGGTTYHGFSDGRLCTSTRIGGSTFTGC